MVAAQTFEKALHCTQYTLYYTIECMYTYTPQLLYTHSDTCPTLNKTVNSIQSHTVRVHTCVIVHDPYMVKIDLASAAGLYNSTQANTLQAIAREELIHILRAMFSFTGK